MSKKFELSNSNTLPRFSGNRSFIRLPYQQELQGFHHIRLFYQFSQQK